MKKQDLTKIETKIPKELNNKINNNYNQEIDTTNDLSNNNSNLNNINNNNVIIPKKNNIIIPCCCNCHKQCNQNFCECQNQLMETNKRLFDICQEFKDLQKKYIKDKEEYEKLKNENCQKKDYIKQLEQIKKENEELNNIKPINEDLLRDNIINYLDMIEQFFKLLNTISNKFDGKNNKIEDMNYYLNKPFEFKNVIDKYINLINDLNIENLNKDFNNNISKKFSEDNINQSINSFYPINQVKNPFIQQNESLNINFTSPQIHRIRKGRLYKAKSFSKIKPSEIKTDYLNKGIDDEELENLRRINHINGISNNIPQSIKDDIKNDLLNPLNKPIGPLQKSDINSFNSNFSPNKNLNYNYYSNYNINNNNNSNNNNNNENNNLYNENNLNDNNNYNTKYNYKDYEFFNDENYINKIKNENLDKNDSDEDNSNNFKDGSCWACNLGCSISQTGYSPMTYSPYKQGYKRKDVTPINKDIVYEEYTRHKK